ncbi:phosphotransferase [Candidatus Dojkabacteria bacterium]|nr:phosphotransferase [Candidatus Dojkabacteria bacterium]
MISINPIKQLLKNEYGLDWFKLENLHGHTDMIYKVTTHRHKYVLKVSLNRKMSKRRFESQINYIQYLQNHDILSPKIIKPCTGNLYTTIKDYRNRYSALFEYIDNLYSPNLSKPSEAREYAKYIGNLHKISHKYNNKHYWYYDPISEETRKLKYLEKFVKKSKRKYLAKLIKIKKDNISRYKKLRPKLGKTMLLNDLSEGNIFKINNNYIFIDWNIAATGYFADEIAWIITWFFIKKNNMKHLSKFLDEYLKHFPLNSIELELLTFMPISYAYTMWDNFEECKTKELFREQEKKILDSSKILEQLIRQVSTSLSHHRATYISHSHDEQ